MTPEKIKLILKLLSATACLPVLIIISLRNYRVETEYTIASLVLSLCLSGFLLAKFLFSEKFKSSWTDGKPLDKVLCIAAMFFLIPATIIVCMLVLIIIGLSVGLLHFTM